MWKSRGFTLSSSWVSKLRTLFLRLSSAALWRKSPFRLLVSETSYLRSLPRTHEHRWGSEHRSSGKSRALPSILRQSPAPCFTHLWTRPLRACLRLDLSPEWEWAEDQGQDVFIVLKFDSFLKNNFIWIHVVEDYVSTFLSNFTASTWSLTL